MNEIKTVTVDLIIKPDSLGHLDLLEMARRDLLGNVLRGVYIKDVNSVAAVGNGSIDEDGNVVMRVNCTTTVANPVVNETYNVRITGANKMGAVYRDEGVTIFIPKHYCTDGIIPDVCTCVDVLIIGRRVDGNIMCIGKIILSSSDQTSLDTNLHAHM